MSRRLVAMVSTTGKTGAEVAAEVMAARARYEAAAVAVEAEQVPARGSVGNPFKIREEDPRLSGDGRELFAVVPEGSEAWRPLSSAWPRRAERPPGGLSIYTDEAAPQPQDPDEE